MNLPASNVLLVEDDPKMHEVLSALLHEDNITLAHAAEPNTRSTWCASNAFDLLLLDLGLPGMNGFEILRQLKEKPARTADAGHRAHRVEQHHGQVARV